MSWLKCTSRVAEGRVVGETRCSHGCQGKFEESAAETTGDWQADDELGFDEFTCPELHETFVYRYNGDGVEPSEIQVMHQSGKKTFAKDYILVDGVWQLLLSWEKLDWPQLG